MKIFHQIDPGTQQFWFAYWGCTCVDNFVIPFGVGLDIGCRMALSIYEVPDN